MKKIFLYIGLLLTTLFTNQPIILARSITPIPCTKNLTFEYPDGNTITSFPILKQVNLAVNVLRDSSFIANATATPDTICQGQTSQLDVSVIGGNPPFTYAWAPITALSDPTIANPLATPDITTTYSVLVTDASSLTATSNVIVNVTGPLTPGPITGLQQICKGAIVPYYIDEIPGATSYSWTPPNPNGGDVVLTGQNTASVTIWFKSGISGNISVVVTNCGFGPSSVLPVTVNKPPIPLNRIIGPNKLCKEDKTMFWTSITDNPATYSWFIIPPQAGTITSGNGTDTISVTWGHIPGIVGTYAYNECGESDSVFKEVNMMEIPEPADTISGMDTVCLGQANYQYTVPVITGATTYFWVVPIGAAISSGLGTNQIAVTFSTTAQSGNLSVKGMNDCGEGIKFEKTIWVNNCSGIGENNLNASVLLYPNPVSNELTLRINGNENELFLSITDITGVVKYEEKLMNIPSNYIKKLSFSNYPKGIYFLKLANNNRVYNTKVIVQ
ncbi:MAG: T9SS type A sorting domain-containing protein [Bacteroidales bacterium]|nr:T9SS type A sorting domain-containing protein [Bacteroidales bacterium]